MNLIEFHDVSKSFKDKKVLSKVSFNIKKGEIVGIIGPSGSGKTTLMRLLLGVIKPDGGSIIYKERDITHNQRFLRTSVGLTTQENSFYEKLTIYENMVYYSNLYGVKVDKKKIEDILTSVRLSKNRNSLAGDISGGMKRRLDFAISLLHDPELLILDEPTTGLDPLLVRQFWAIVKTMENKTIIIISHILEEIKENCAEAFILNNGKVDSVKITKGMDIYKTFEDAVK